MLELIGLSHGCFRVWLLGKDVAVLAKQAAKKRGVYERVPGSGIWHVHYEVNGKRVRKSIGTRQQAIDYLNKVNLIKATGAGTVPTTAKRPAKSFNELEHQGGLVTVGNLCDQYLAHIQNPNNPERPRDQVNPPIRIEAIKQAFGERPAGSVKPHEVKDWLINEVGGKPATMNRYKSTFSAIYRYAKERALINSNPVRDTQQFKVALPPPRYLKPDEEKRLYDVLNRWIAECPDKHRYTKLLLRSHPYEVDVAIGTGLRKGNQYELRTEWLDFPSRLIKIPESKNGEAITVPMIDRTYKALKALEALHNEFTSLENEKRLKKPHRRATRLDTEGRVFLIRENREWWEKALKEARIKNFRWHDLRHTTGSLMAQAGVNLKAIQEALAHKSIATTVRYAHLNKAVVMDAMSVLNRPDR